MAGFTWKPQSPGIGGFSVRGASNKGQVDLARPREIEQRDVNRAMERALRVQLQEDRMMLHVLPQAFVVDDQDDCQDPATNDGLAPRRQRASGHRLHA